MTTRQWCGWIAILALATCIQLPTLDRSASIHQDETQILELGRVTLFERNSDWSINWTRLDRPAVAFPAYLGCTLQYLLSLWTLPSTIGPRLGSMLGAVLAASAMLAWLRAWMIPPLICSTLALAFYCDPVFVASYQSGRVDSWALATGLAACLMLRLATVAGTRASSLALLGTAGALSVTATLIWWTAVLLHPLIVLELVAYLTPSITGERTRGSVMAQVGAFTLGAFVAGALLLLPVLGYWFDPAGMSAVLRVTLLDRTKVAWSSLLLNGKALWQATKLSPIFLASFLACPFVRSARSVCLTLLCLLSFLLATWLYPMRLLYLLPYSVLIVAIVAAMLHGAGWRLTAVCGAATFLTYSATISLGLRTATALAWEKEKDPAILLSDARHYVGSGPTAVFLDTHGLGLYPSGRVLGWHMFQPYEPEGDFDEYYSAVLRILPRVTLAIIRPDPSSRLAGLLNDQGFQLVAKFRDPPVDRRYPYRLGLGHPPYGPYMLYCRKGAQRPWWGPQPAIPGQR